MKSEFRRRIGASLPGAWAFLAGAIAAGAQELPAGSGKELVQRMCAKCHEISVVTDQRMSKDLWSSTVDDMVARGAVGTKDEIAAVVEYLAKNFGPAGKDKVERTNGR